MNLWHTVAEIYWIRLSFVTTQTGEPSLSMDVFHLRYIYLFTQIFVVLQVTEKVNSALE